MQQRARRLGCKFRQRTPCTDLLRSVQDNEQRGLPADSLPNCFGLRFAAPLETACAACDAQALCLHRCAHGSLLETCAKLPSWRAEDVAAAMHLPVRSVHLLLDTAVMSGSLPRQRRGAVPLPSTPHDAAAQAARRQREMARVPELAQLPAGTMLRRVYDGRPCEVRVVAEGYACLGQTFPTLYAATTALTGPRAYARGDLFARKSHRIMGNYSVRRFWGRTIDAALSALPHPKPTQSPRPTPPPPPAATAPASATTDVAAAGPAAPQ